MAYLDYSEKLADLLIGYSPQALARIGGGLSLPMPLRCRSPRSSNPSQYTFPSPSSDLTSGAQHELDKMFEYLKGNPSARIVIEGHTDANEGYDQALSESRALAASLYTADLGVDVARINTVGYAGTQPIEEGNSNGAKAANRRIEIGLLN